MCVCVSVCVCVCVCVWCVCVCVCMCSFNDWISRALVEHWSFSVSAWSACAQRTVVAGAMATSTSTEAVEEMIGNSLGPVRLEI